MSINVLKDYIEQCLRNNIEPTFNGLNKFYKDNKVDNKKEIIC